MSEKSPYVPLSLAVLCVSLGSILVRVAAAPPLAVAFYRIFLASLLLAPFALGALVRSWPALGRKDRLLLLGAGAVLALHFFTWIASLSYTSVASSVLLVNTAPLFTLGFSRIFLGETPPPIVLVATAFALFGAVLIAAGDWAEGPSPLKGDLLALMGAVALSLYHVTGRGLRRALPLSAYILGVWSTAALVLALLTIPFRTPLGGYPIRTLSAFLALAIVPTLLGHGLVNRSLRVLPAPTVGLFLLGEPIGATILAYVFFGETAPRLTLAGGGVVLVALGLASFSEAP
jgi:drug/metabolite transporter (DMT)-like permease